MSWLKDLRWYPDHYEHYSVLVYIFWETSQGVFCDKLGSEVRHQKFICGIMATVLDTIGRFLVWWKGALCKREGENKNGFKSEYTPLASRGVSPVISS